MRTVDGVEGTDIFADVEGKGTVEDVEIKSAFAGVVGIVLVGFVRESEEGVIGNGMAKASAPRLFCVMRVFVSDEREGEGGGSKDGGVTVFGDLGESDTRR